MPLPCPGVDLVLDTPPGSCDDGACYLIAGSATGAWSGHDGNMAVGEDAADRTEANTTSAGSHGSSTTAARTSIVHIRNAGLDGVIKSCSSNGFADRLFVGDTSPITAIRAGVTSGNMTGGSIVVLVRQELTRRRDR